jgi:AraC-like DNA-binding protein
VSGAIRSPWFSLARAYGASRGIAMDTTRADATTFAAQAQRFASACDDEHLGASIARWMPRGTYRLVEYAARNAPTLEDAMEIAAAYAPLMNDRLRMRVVRTRAEVRVEHWVAGEPSSLGRHFDEFAMTTAVRFVDEVTGGRARVSRVEFVHVAEPRRSPADLFAAPVRYGADRNAFCFPRTFAECPLHGDATLSRLLCELSDREIAEAPRWDVATRARVAVAEALASSDAEAQEVAGKLGVSVRTLERRLGEQRTTFAEVRDRYRRDLALHLVARKTQLPEAAKRLRFGTTRGLVRALTRWSATIAVAASASACSVVTDLGDLKKAVSSDADAATDAVVLPTTSPCIAPTDDASVLLNLTSAFSDEQGSCGLSYGAFMNGDTTFAPLPLFDSTVRAWLASQGSFLLITASALSPVGNGEPVLRWTSSYTGLVRIVGSAALGDPGEPIAGNGITLRIRVGTEEVYALTLAKTDSDPVPFDVTTSVVAGGTVDFVDDPIDGNAYYDATTFTLRISKGE